MTNAAVETSNSENQGIANVFLFNPDLLGMKKTQ